MNNEFDIYDFDKTVVPFDSGSRFLIYCARHYPQAALYMPAVAFFGALMLLHIISLKTFKRYCFLFVKFIPLEKAVKGFWDKNEKYVHKWFCKRQRACVVISASPDFLLGEIAKRLGVDYLICTKYNMKTLKIVGENCRDEEKVKRLKAEIPAAKIVDVYSDSFLHDKPIFSLAQGKCFNVANGVPCEFNFDKHYNGVK